MDINENLTQEVEIANCNDFSENDCLNAQSVLQILRNFRAYIKANAKQGERGATGKSIIDIKLTFISSTENGDIYNLSCTLSDNSIINAGNFLSPKGVKGDKGDKGDAGVIKFIPVNQLPTTDIDPNAIYLLPKQTTETQNIYDEYIYVNGQWEQIAGGVSLDLTDYVKNTDYATGSVGGVIKVGAGLTMVSGSLQIQYASETQIRQKIGYRNPIVPQFLDLAIKTGLINNQYVLTDDEKTNIQTWLGLIDTIDNVNNLITSVTELNQQIGRTLKTPMLPPSETILVGVDDGNAQVNIKVGDSLQLVNNELETANETLLLNITSHTTGGRYYLNDSIINYKYIIVCAPYQRGDKQYWLTATIPSILLYNFQTTSASVLPLIANVSNTMYYVSIQMDGDQYIKIFNTLNMEGRMRIYGCH